MEEVEFFGIFKMHLLVSAQTFFGETQLHYTTLLYCNLVEYQRVYAVLHHFPQPVNMAKNSKFHLGAQIDQQHR